MSPIGITLLLGTIFAALGAIILLIGFAVGRGRRSGWVQTVGRWTRYEGTFSRGWQVEYRDADGGVHRVMPLMNATTFAPQGDMPISYDPTRPERAVIDTFYHRGGVLKIMGGIFIGIGVVVALVGVALGL